MPLLTMAVLALALTGASAGYAQESSPDFNQEGIANYCFYNGKAYSVGSMMCVPQSKTALVCQSTAEDQNKSGTTRAVWKPKSSEIACK
jgi:Protein of unknown function (DUF1496)